jgi:hypothetical protein
VNDQGLPVFPAHHRRLLIDIFDLGRPYGLALMGGYAVQAHGIVHRPSQDLDFATTHPTALPLIADRLTQGLSARGWRVSALHAAPLKARFLATDPDSGQSCEVDLLKEVLWQPPVVLGLGPVIALEDLIATKVRALGDRGLPRDVIDVHAASEQFSSGELEALGARRPEEFDVQELHDRLESVAWVSDAEFEAYGLDPARIAELRHWAQRWQDDLAQRLAEPFTDGDDVGGY